jgi:quinol monooxygenase YgiN
MVTKGLLVQLEVRSGKDAEAEVFLRSALAKVQSEPATSAWFAVRFGRSDYGIFDVFSDEDGRQAHLNGAVARGIMERVGTLFTKAPRIQKLDVIAAKLPEIAFVDPITKGLFLTFKAKDGHERQVEQFLRDGQDIVRQEPKTVSWFAIRLENGEYGIFDVFPDSAGRFTHLTGHVPRELAKHAMSLLGGFPDIDLINVLASIPGVERVQEIIEGERAGI